MEPMGTGRLAFMELILGVVYMYHACVRGNNKRSSNLTRHPPQASAPDKSPSAVAASRPTSRVYHTQMAPFGPCASWVAPVLSTLWTNSLGPDESPSAVAGSRTTSMVYHT